MNNLWKNDDELFRLMRNELFTAVVGDMLDKLKLYHQFLPPSIQPLQRGMIAVGRAMTVLEADCFDDRSAQCESVTLRKPFGLMLKALDDLKHNEIYVCAGASPRYALWGELMSIRARKCGSAGAVLDGYARDLRAILDLNFPTFSLGSYAQDQAPRGKVTDFRIAIQIGETRIYPGDIIFGDVDGVCVIPHAVETDVFSLAIEKARTEKHVRKALESGMSAEHAFEEYGVL